MAIALVQNQGETFSIMSLTSAIGFGGLNAFGFFFSIVEVAQDVNLYLYLNIKKPLNLDILLNFLSEFRFYSHIDFLKKFKLVIPKKNFKIVPK